MTRALLVPSTAPIFSQACALNNLGVAMIQRGEFRSSELTLNDSVSTLRMLVLGKLQTEDETAFSSCSPSVSAAVQRDLQMKLWAASCLYAQMVTRKRENEPAVPVNTVESNDMRGLFATQAQVPCVGPDISLPTSSYTAVYIRQDIIKSSCELNKAQAMITAHLLCGIVLYNYAIACHLHSLLPEDQQLGDKSSSTEASRIMAESALNMSYSIFSFLLRKKKLQQETGFYWTLSTDEERQAALLAMITLSGLNHVYHHKIHNISNNHNINTLQLNQQQQEALCDAIQRALEAERMRQDIYSRLFREAFFFQFSSHAAGFISAPLA